MSLFDIKVKNIKGEERSLEDYKGKTLMIVNVASECGFTPQYADLEDAYKKYKEQGLMVLGFPCNQFGGQEPAVEDKIEEFCKVNYGVTFPLFAKVDVNGENAHPLFQYLKKELAGIFGSEGIKWNFTKFVIDKEGKPFKRYAPKDEPKKIMEEVKSIL